MSTKKPVMPPHPKLPFTFPRRMRSRTFSATASEMPPLPVCIEKPSRSRPDASITWAA